MANQNGGTMTVKDQKIANFKGLVNTQAMVKRMTSTCGGEKEGKQFMASMLDLFETDSDLQNCNPQKVLSECLKAASLNLPIIKSLGYTYIVPFGNNPTFIIGYKGLIQLALRSGQYRCLNADAIYEGEEISFDRLSGKLAITGEKASDKAIGYFAYFQLVNGFEKTFYMTIDDVKAYANKYSPSYNSSKSPWKTEFDSMAKKTVLRQILKYGPSSTDMQKAELIDVENAEKAAKATVEQNANMGEIIDIPADDLITIDKDTGEVVETKTEAPQETAEPEPEF